MALKFENDTGGVDSKHFIRLKDGESVVCVLRGAVRCFKQHWKNGKPSLCTGDNCQSCKNNEKAIFRFHVNAVTKDGANNVVKIIEQGWTVYENIRTLSDEMDLEKVPLKIVRKGTTMNDTAYTLIPMGSLSPEQDENMSKMKLFDLSQLDKELASLREPKNDSQAFAEENIPF